MTNRIVAFALLAALIFVNADALAQVSGVGASIQKLNNDLKKFPNVIAAIAQLLGLAFALKAAFSMREAGEKDDKDGAKKALFFMIAGTGLVGLPALLGFGATTLLGGTDAIMTGANPINVKGL